MCIQNSLLREKNQYLPDLIRSVRNRSITGYQFNVWNLNSPICNTKFIHNSTGDLFESIWPSTTTGKPFDNKYLSRSQVLTLFPVSASHVPFHGANSMRCLVLVQLGIPQRCHKYEGICLNKIMLLSPTVSRIIQLILAIYTWTVCYLCNDAISVNGNKSFGIYFWISGGPVIRNLAGNL